jgi:type I restriction enzyme S subunit
MNPEQLLQHFDRISEAPDAIPRLRQFILNLAVRGKLVPQNPNDQPAGELLKQVLISRKEKWEQNERLKYSTVGKQLPKNWQIKYVVPEHEDGLFSLPQTWVWASTLEACDRVENGNTPPASEMADDQGEIPFIKVYNLTKNGELDFSVKPTFISRETHEKRLSRSKILPGDVLMNIVGPPLGKVSVVPEIFPEWNTNQAIVLFRPSFCMLSRYLAICLLSNDVLIWITRLAQATVGQVNISVSKSRMLPIPLPPIAEQHRIVAKVDELMALCDQLQAAQTEREQSRDRLVAASLHSLNPSTDD